MSCPLVVLLLLVVITNRVDACSCIPDINSTYIFNQSDFVSRVLVVKEQRLSSTTLSTEYVEQPPEKIYTVKHLDVYKSPNSTVDLPTQVRTPGDSAACGVTLTEGQTLVLAGSLKPSHLSIFLCSFAQISQAEGEKLRTTSH